MEIEEKIRVLEREIEGFKKLPEQWKIMLARIWATDLDDGYIVHQVTNDVLRVGHVAARYFIQYRSPSWLGMANLLGLRKLAKLRRDDREKFEELTAILYQ